MIDAFVCSHDGACSTEWEKVYRVSLAEYKLQRARRQDQMRVTCKTKVRPPTYLTLRRT